MSTWYKRSSKLAFDMFRSFVKQTAHGSSSITRFERNVLFSGAAIIFLGHSTDINAYSGRVYFNLVPRYLENMLGEYKINRIKEEFKEDVLPPDHPHATRVKLIAKNMIESPIRSFCTRRCSLATQYPEYRNSEVIVIDRPIVKACCYAGKLVIFTGILDRLESDAEIATVIGHEVAHDWAGHAARKITQMPWVAFLRLIVRLSEPCVHYKDEKRHYCFRRIEREADYLGGLLMASAGYDPSVAPTVYARLSEDVVVSDNCSIFPTGKKRAALLSRPEVMGKLMMFWNNNNNSNNKNSQLNK